MTAPDDKDSKQTQKGNRLTAALRFSKRRADKADIEWANKKRPPKKPK